MDSLHQKPSSPGIPRRIREILPAGQWQFVADLAKRPKITKYLVTHTKQHKYFFYILRIWMMHIEWRTDEELHFLHVPITPDEEHYQPFEVIYFHELIGQTPAPD